MRETGKSFAIKAIQERQRERLARKYLSGLYAGIAWRYYGDSVAGVYRGGIRKGRGEVLRIATRTHTDSTVRKYSLTLHPITIAVRQLMISRMIAASKPI